MKSVAGARGLSLDELKLDGLKLAFARGLDHWLDLGLDHWLDLGLDHGLVLGLDHGLEC